MSKSSLVRFKDFLANRPEGGAFIGIVALLVFFSLGTEHFLTLKSFGSMLTMMAIWGIVAMGVTLLMISGEFDLSVGSVLGLSALSVAVVAKAGIPSPIVVVMMLIICVAIGLLHGLAVVKLGIPSFIITLAGMMICRGIMLTMTSKWGFIYVPREDALFQFLSYQFVSGFNISAIWFLIVTVIIFILLHRTRFGNWIFATGGNKLAAIQAGVPVNRVKLIVFSLTAGLAGLAGIIEMSRFAQVGPQRGLLVEMYTIAIVVIGGTRLAGGYGSVVGTVLGLILMAITKNGLSLMGVPGYWFDGCVGAVILIAVIINTNAQRRALGGKNE